MKLQLSSGKKLMGWLLVRKLGEGAFGQVWYAQADGGFGETALKFIDATGDNREKAKREYATLKMMCENRAFQSSRLIKLQGVWLLDEDEKPIPDAKFGETVFGATLMMDEVGPQPDALMIQMDLAQSNLAELLDSTVENGQASDCGGLPITDLLPFIYQAAKGIDFLNRTPRIFHCDIKPENLLLVDGEVKICDYGGARKEGIERKNKKNVLSLAHASPELMNNAPCEYSDQYSLAITYVQLRTGRLPYSDTILRSRSVSTVRDAVLRGDLDLSGLPPAERAVIKRATSLKPEKRFPTATAMAVELDRAINQGAAPKRKGLLIGALAIVLLAAGAAALRPWNWRPQPVIDGGGSATTDTDGADDDSGDQHQNVPVVEDQAKLAEEIAASIDGAMRWLDQPSISGAEADVRKRELTALAGRIGELKQPEAQQRLSNLRALALARFALLAAWPNADQPPPGAVRIIADRNSTMWTAERREDIAGLSESDWETLLALRALEAWPGSDAELPGDQLSSVAAPLAAIPYGDNKLAPLERTRCAALAKKLRDAVTQAAENGAPLPSELNASLQNLFGADFLFGIAIENVLEAARAAAKQAGEFSEAKAEAEQLSALANGNLELLAKVPWYAQFAKLGDADSPAAMVYLGQNPGDLAQQQAIADVLRARFARAAISDWPLPILSAAVDLSTRLSAATDPAPERLQALLLAQRLAARSALPESPGNRWNHWAADCQSLEKRIENQRAALAGEPAGSWVGLPFVELCQIELGATLARTTMSRDAAALRRWRDGLEKLRGDEDAWKWLNEAQFPGYYDYVSALVESLEGSSEAAAEALQAAYAVENGTVAAKSPCLDWTERRAVAARILSDSVEHLRNRPLEDLSAEPFSATNAAKAVARLEMAAGLSGDKLTAADAAWLAMAKSSAAEFSPQDRLALVDPLVGADSPPNSAAQAQLLLASALAHASLAQGGDPNEGKLAVERFAGAVAFYDAWASTQPADQARDQRLELRVLKPARDVLRPYVNVDASRIDASVRPAVAQLAAMIGRVNVALSRAGALPLDTEMTPRVIANWLKLANDAAAEPRMDLLKLEGSWLRDMLVHGQGGGASGRLVELKRLVTGSDPESLALRGIATFFEYRQQKDWPAKKQKLDESLELFNQAIGGAANATDDTARYYLDRGGVNLQLAYVLYKGRGDLGDTAKSIKDYLDDAIQDARLVTAADLTPSLRVEAYNLLGNASEDMFFYEVDVAGDRIDFHFRNAEEAFNNAFKLDSQSPDAAFNLARCTFRYGRAQRYYVGVERYDDTKYQQGLKDANEAIESALSTWGAAKNEMKAEALYWQGEIQEELGNFQLAEEKFGAAAALAQELGDARWSAFQLMWAQMALNRLDAATTATRLRSLIDASGVAPTADGLANVVDKQTLADAVYLLIRSQTGPDKAREVLDAYLPRFAGDTPADLACQARLRLAYANSLLAQPGRAVDVEEEAKRVLALTSSPNSGASWNVFRSQAHLLLGLVAFQQIDPRNKPKTLEAALRAVQHYEEGMKQVADSHDFNAQENWVANARQFVDAAVKVVEVGTDQTQRARVAQQVHDCFDEFERRMDAALPGRKMNGRLPRDWKQDAVARRKLLLDRGFPASKRQ